MSDILSVIIWWLTIFIVGTIFLPITTVIFRKFIDRGYIFTKVIGILLSSYLMWLMASLHLLPFTKLTLIVILLGFSTLSMYLVTKSKGKDNPIPWRLFIFEEILFLATLSFWSYVRATEPSIRSLEKFMDFGFVNSILRSTYFPPLDMWLTKSPDYAPGYFINYYYFGHYIAAFLTKLSGLDSAVTYNLMIATLFAFTFTLPFSIGMNLYYLFLSFRATERSRGISRFTGMWKISRLSGIPPDGGDLHAPPNGGLVGMTKLIIVGLLAAFLVSLGGNLHALYVFTSGYPNDTPAPPWKLELGIHPERYWYPNATRFIPFTIHEFPIYSFVVADLHGHVSDIPFVMLLFAILLTLITSRPHLSDLGLSRAASRGNLRKLLAEFENHTSIPLPIVFFLGILLATMYMTNAWDGLIYMVLAGLVFLYVNLRRVILVTQSEARRHPGSRNDSGHLPADATHQALQAGARMTLFAALYKTFSASLFLVFFFLVASLSFSLNFKPFVSGVGVLCAPKFLEGKALGPLLFESGKCQKSPLYMLAILWGFFYFNVIGYLVFVIIPSLRKKLTEHKVLNRSRQARTIKYYSSSDERSEESRSSGIWNLEFGNLNPIDIFVLLLILISTLLLIFPEFFYIKDIYPAHYRANTMFKLGYQAFMMLGIVSAYIFMRIKSLSPVIPNGVSNLSQMRDSNSNKLRDPSISLGMTLRAIFHILFYILFFLVAIYPTFAINSYYGNLQTYRGLYGLSWMVEQYPDDYKAILWLRKNINGQPVIAEANGDSYTDYDRVSANTGLPTIIGWPVHEWLWRGSYDEAGKRIPEVAAIYESEDLENTKSILKKYKVEYIFVGKLEKEKYKNLKEEKFSKLGEMVFQSGGTKIYKISSM